MCWAEKCCYCMPLHKACVLLGISNFVISVSFIIASLACYIGQRNMTIITKDQVHAVVQLMGLEWKVQTVNIILSVVALISVFWMIFSILLVVGMTKNEPSLVLCYFSFGIILTIIWMLSGLLMLINQFWWQALIILIISMINIHYLVVVHSVYDLMQKGNFSFQRQRNQEEDPLAECFDDTVHI